MLAKMATNMKLDSLLQEVLANSEKVQELAKQMGIDESAPASGEEAK
jgi:hypothetical protein